MWKHVGSLDTMCRFPLYDSAHLYYCILPSVPLLPTLPSVSVLPNIFAEDIPIAASCFFSPYCQRFADHVGSFLASSLPPFSHHLHCTLLDFSTSRPATIMHIKRKSMMIVFWLSVSSIPFQDILLIQHLHSCSHNQQFKRIRKVLDRFWHWFTSINILLLTLTNSLPSNWSQNGPGI